MNATTATTLTAPYALTMSDRHGPTLLPAFHQVRVPTLAWERGDTTLTVHATFGGVLLTAQLPRWTFEG